MSSKKKNIFFYWGKVILITLLVVLLIRSFISVFSVSSSQMEATLHDGDRILIDKTAYGLRLPITVLSIAFSFDKILGFPSYSTLWQAPYKRIFAKAIDYNDVVLFNNPLESEKPIDKRELLLSRCVALPGDTIEVKNGFFFINGKQYEATPNRIEQYWIRSIDSEELENIADEEGLTILDLKKSADTLLLKLSKYDAYILNENLPDTLQKVTSIETDSAKNYKIIIPQEGQRIKLNEESLIVYQQIILQEQCGKRITSSYGTLSINGINQQEYIFEDSYYWFLSDNATNSTDSRSLGFISFKHVIGRASYLWYSPASIKKSYNNLCFLPIE